ncbi:hypothetical protein [Vibrio cholerae]|uniref:hypothetical protein n=1 Tax=Vibrio cholerae TaxID=666 RepID=UPI0006E4B3C7|nr:hypothetical protein [Vibrio cholerae]KQA39935.1 hypothetical protein XV74_06780 [Vibrio cholerae]KQA46742.1 hypothetical protein XV75_06590 [Vibrio cholerae]KQA59633.1 hypothetical protein XV79_02855 [Vibrio cholerae]KQA76513.1 hypothetical protein XV84_03010 [Vibrio cholerae]KQA77727.1 hypothetical protein XV85_12860 [Vibrio cholerae]
MRCAQALGMIGLLSCPPAWTQEPLKLDWDWMVSASHAQRNDSLVWAAAQDDEQQQVDIGLDLQSRWHGWTASLALTSRALYRSDEQAKETRLTLSELFWQGESTLVGQTLDITAGKIRLDWGVGYGYRPLDLFLPYRRNPLGIQVEEGAGVLALSSYQELGEWTLIATDSAWGRSSEAQLVTQNEQQGIGLRHYRLIGESEIQGIVYYDNVRRGLVGGSWVSVLNSTWGMHSSWLYQREYWQYQRQTEQPIELVKQENAAQFLFGINWANPEGHNVIAEYWYDGRSWNADEWQQILADATLLHQQGRSPMAFAYAQGYQATNIVAHNFMLHWTWDSGNGQRFGMDNLTPTLDVLWSPEEGGWMITQWINWQAYDTGSASLELELAARFFGGETDSAYANLSDSVRVLFNLKGKF